MNLQYIKTLKTTSGSRRSRPNLEGLKETRLKVVTHYASHFYSPEEIEQAASNRRSNSTDEAVIADFMTFDLPEFTIPKDEHYYRALRVTKSLFDPGETLYPVSFPDLRYYPWNLKPNAEAPWNLSDFEFKPNFRDLDNETETPKLKEHLEKLSYYLSDQRVLVTDYLKAKVRAGIIKDDKPSFHNLYSEIFFHNRPLLHFIKDGLTPFWRDGTPVPYFHNTLHARSHVVSKDEPDKIRAVFGSTKLLLMIENMFIWPLQKTYLNQDKGILLWGRETIKGGWNRLYIEATRKGRLNTFLSLDWSQFDKRLLFEIIDEVHGIWRSYFDFESYWPTSFYPNAKPNPERVERAWKWMCHSIKHTPILLPNGKLYQWQFNGFGSGYQQTQLMDSVANTIMILTCLSALGINIEDESFWIRIQGDDSLIGFPERMFRIYGSSFLDKIGEKATYYFNATLNVKKSQISDNLNHMSVLGYSNRFGMPYRSDEDLLRHLMFPERPGPLDQLLAAAIGLARSACGCSIRFHKLCETIITVLSDQGRIPDSISLRWLVRANILEQADVERMLSEPLPDSLELRALVKLHSARTDTQKERLWPSKPGARKRFFFLPPRF